MRRSDRLIRFPFCGSETRLRGAGVWRDCVCAVDESSEWAMHAARVARRRARVSARDETVTAPHTTRRATFSASRQRSHAMNFFLRACTCDAS